MSDLLLLPFHVRFMLILFVVCLRQGPPIYATKVPLIYRQIIVTLDNFQSGDSLDLSYYC
jgi:hypothetical protein